MTDLSAVKELRNKTQAALSECRQTLEETGGDIGKAAELLRLRGKLIAERKASRAANAGIVDAYVHPNGRVGVLVELRCETDFVARNELFRKLAHDISLQVAAMQPLYLAPSDVPRAVVAQERASLQAELRSSGKPDAVIEKIIEGKIAKFVEERSLLGQLFVKDSSRRVRDLITDAVSQLGENVRIERFARFEL